MTNDSRPKKERVFLALSAEVSEAVKQQPDYRPFKKGVLYTGVGGWIRKHLHELLLGTPAPKSVQDYYNTGRVPKNAQK